jgi:ABC-2 type transport system ATP-binding protein
MSDDSPRTAPTGQPPAPAPAATTTTDPSTAPTTIPLARFAKGSATIETGPPAFSHEASPLASSTPQPTPPLPSLPIWPSRESTLESPRFDGIPLPVTKESPPAAPVGPDKTLSSLEAARETTSPSNAPRPAQPGSTVLVLDRVHASDRMGPRGRPRGALSGLSLKFGPGVHAVLGAPEDGTLALVDALSGERSPARGRVLVLGRDPAKSALVRARVGVLGAQTRLPPAGSVADAVRMAMRARGEPGDRFDAVLDPLGLGALHARPTRSLSYAEGRAIELALAITTPAPILVALYEPFADVALASNAVVRARLAELANAGACVVIATSSVGDTREVAEHVLVLRRGLAIIESTQPTTFAELGFGCEMTAYVPATDAARAVRKLARAIAQRPGVRGVSWEETGPRALLRVRGASPEACALALTDAANEADIALEAIALSSPSLVEIQGVAESMARARLAAERERRGPAA